MESGNTECEAVHAAVQRRPEQMRYDGAGRIDVYQGAARPDVVLSEILSRGHLRVLRDEHRRREHPGLYNVTTSFYHIIFDAGINQAIGISNSLNLVLGNFDVSLVAWSGRLGFRICG